jgi:hypothetical protein
MFTFEAATAATKAQAANQAGASLFSGFRASGGKAGKRSHFGVTSADGKSVGFGIKQGGAEDEDRGKGVHIADPVIAGCVLQLSVTTAADAVFRVTGQDHTTATVLLATRPPQYGAACIDGATAKTLPFKLAITGYADGVSAPVYTMAQAAYTRVLDTVGVPQGVLPPLFTTRGCPPDVHDATQLWSLPSLDPEDTPPKYVAVEENAVQDILAWAAWTLVSRRLVDAEDWVTTCALRFFTPELVAFLKDLRRCLEASLQMNLEQGVRAIQVRVASIEALLRECGNRILRRKVALSPDLSRCADGADAAEARTALAWLPAEYVGAARLCVAQERSPGVTPGDLLRASVWMATAVHYLTAGLQQLPAEGEDGDTTGDPPAPVPVTIPRALPLERFAYAALIACACVHGRGLPPHLALAIAARMCGGPRFLRPADRDVLVQFADSRFSLSRGLGWIAQWS